MSQLLFPAQPPAVVAVRGRAERFPIRRIFCVGRNYEAHAKEMGVAVDREAPFYFTKAAGRLRGVRFDNSPIRPVPATITMRWSWWRQSETGFPRCRGHRRWISVFGYACGLDMTRRDLQFAARASIGRPWDLERTSSSPRC